MTLFELLLYTILQWTIFYFLRWGVSERIPCEETLGLHDKTVPSAPDVKMSFVSDECMQHRILSLCPINLAVNCNSKGVGCPGEGRSCQTNPMPSKEVVRAKISFLDPGPCELSDHIQTLLTSDRWLCCDWRILCVRTSSNEKLPLE
jgi:hypothetical protein